jgi:hypothetical protein
LLEPASGEKVMWVVEADGGLASWNVSALFSSLNELILQLTAYALSDIVLYAEEMTYCVPKYTVVVLSVTGCCASTASATTTISTKVMNIFTIFIDDTRSDWKQAAKRQEKSSGFEISKRQRNGRKLLCWREQANTAQRAG